MKRQKRLQSAAQLIGNAAAHAALYQDQSGIREAIEYTGQAIARIEVKSWNPDEIERFRGLANRRAQKEIQLRTGVNRGVKYETAVALAAQYIEAFIADQMR
jgi:hypothetical protein